MGKDMSTMRMRVMELAFCVAGLSLSAAAQTNTFPASGNVGIGTTTPVVALDVAIGNIRSEGYDFQLSTQSGWNGWDRAYSFISPSGTQLARFGAFGGNTNSLSYAYIGPSFSSPVAVFTSVGNVGIGTTSPAAKLDVNGSINISGTSAGITFPNGGGTQSVAWTGVLCGGDYAESVDVTGSRTNYEPGDLLVIDPNNSGKFLKSAEPYSTAVMGIYSTKPGALGRRQTTPKSADEVPMAMIGIVPTKVSAENGAIKPGDLLVTSSMPGYAMKGTDRSRLVGAIIGKAMGRLDVGSGVIEVGVTLQ